MVFIECVQGTSDKHSQTTSIEPGHFCWGMTPKEIVARLKVNRDSLELDTKSPEIKLYKLQCESEQQFELMELIQQEGQSLTPLGNPSNGALVTGFDFVVSGNRYKVKVLQEQGQLAVEHYLLEPVERFVGAELVNLDLLTDSSGSEGFLTDNEGANIHKIRVEYLLSRSLKESSGRLVVDKLLLQKYKGDNTYLSSKF